MKLCLHIQVATTVDCLPDNNSFERWVNSALCGEKDEAELCIRIVDVEESRQLNYQYRQMNKPTNVLSFPAKLPQQMKLPLLGDLVICAPLVVQEAQEQNKATQAHWAHLVIHGALHLLGYDHVTEAGAKIMETLETKILSDLHFPLPYEDQAYEYQ